MKLVVGMAISMLSTLRTVARLHQFSFSYLYAAQGGLDATLQMTTSNQRTMWIYSLVVFTVAA